MTSNVIRVACLGAVLAALAGCGTSVSVDTKGNIAVDHKTLDVTGVPFTFQYPVDYQEATDASLRSINALAVVGPAADSYIAVRRNGRVTLSVKALEAQARRALGDAILATARETHSGIPMVVMTVADTGGAAKGLHSTIYGFSTAGASWLIECHSAAADRSALTAGCAQALGSIKQRSA